MNTREQRQQWYQEWCDKNDRLGAISNGTLIETDWENITKEEFMRIMDEQNK